MSVLRPMIVLLYAVCVPLLPLRAAGRRPVFLVHGFDGAASPTDGQAVWSNLGRLLQADGWTEFGGTENYGDGRTADTAIEQVADAAIADFNAFAAAHPDTTIDVISHSMGGLVIRAMLAGGIDRSRIEHLITLGAPHYGSDPTLLGMSSGQIDQMTLGGSFLWDLAIKWNDPAANLPDDRVLCVVGLSHGWGDGLVPYWSAALGNTPARYVDRSHLALTEIPGNDLVPGNADDFDDPVYRLIRTFLEQGTVLDQSAIDPRSFSFSEGALFLRVVDRDGDPVSFNGDVVQGLVGLASDEFARARGAGAWANAHGIEALVGPAVAGSLTHGLPAGNRVLTIHAAASGEFPAFETESIAITGGRVTVRTITPPGTMIVQPPSGQSAIAGDPVTLSVTASGLGPLTYQWRFEGSEIPGATAATYVIPAAERFHAGNYSVTVTSAGGTVTSAVATLIVEEPEASDSRLLNLSTRALVQRNDNVLIPGFVIAGTGTKQLLIRAVGPTLGVAPFNVPGVLADPRILVKKHNFTTGADDDVDANDNWGSNANFAELKQVMADLYAFAIPDDSSDAALLLDLTPGQYTIVTDGVANATGIAIVELYDADASGASARLVNISNRGFVGTGANVMIPGFVISSEGAKTLLIRAVGPTLAGAPYNVGGTMTDPKLTVVMTDRTTGQGTEILNQDNWGENPDATFTAQTAQAVSAFPLNAGSADAAFVVTLPPGLYTVIGASADSTSTGVVLVEVYVVE